MSQLKNRFNNLEVMGKPMRGVGSLPIGQPLPICSMKRVPTKYGVRLLVELQDFSVFLPERYANIFSDSELQELNGVIVDQKEKTSLLLRGMKHGVADLALL